MVRVCVACELDRVPFAECYPVASCDCYICGDIVAEEEGYPLYREQDLEKYTHLIPERGRIR